MINKFRLFLGRLAVKYKAAPFYELYANRFTARKKQIIYGRTFKNADEARQAVARFMEPYNSSWHLGKLGYISPLEYKQVSVNRMAAW